MQEQRVDPRQTTAEEHAEGVRQAQVLFKLNHTMPYTDEYNALVRELFGSGTLWGYPVMEKLGLYGIGYENNGLMIMPPMALILVGLIIWWHRSRNKDLCEK